MTKCTLPHRYNPQFDRLPDDQGGHGRHKCAACAYQKGYQDGFTLQDSPNLDLNSLPDSQAGSVRHKSPHAAYALGYLHGVEDHYGKKITVPLEISQIEEPLS